MGVIGCFLCSQEFGCSLIVLGEFLVVSSWVGVFLDVFECFHKFLVFLSGFWCLAIFRCSLKVLGVLKIFGVVPSWFVV